MFWCRIVSSNSAWCVGGKGEATVYSFWYWTPRKSDNLYSYVTIICIGVESLTRLDKNVWRWVMHREMASPLLQEMTSSGVSMVDWQHGHKGKDSLPCLHNIAYVGIHQWINFIVLAREWRDKLDRYLCRANKLMCDNLASDRPCRVDMYDIVGAKPIRECSSLPKSPITLWSCGKVEYTAHSSWGETSGSEEEAVPNSHSVCAILLHQML